MRSGRGEKEVPCNCVFRAIFRACYGRFRECVARGAYMSRVSLERFGGPHNRCTYSRKVEDYMADFCLVSRRALDDQEHQVFRYHFLLGADWKLCCRFLKMDRGNFFHTIYRIEQKLGRTFRELEPYGLYPLDEYFGGRINERPKVTVMPIERERRLRPMIRRSA